MDLTREVMGMFNKIVRPDSKGRITLGPLAKGVSGYKLKETKEHSLILEALVERPAREVWLHNNKAALKSLENGLQEAKSGQITERGSFAQFADDDIE